MKKHLAPALFSLSLCAVMGGVRTAGAQTLDAIARSSVDSTTTAAAAAVALSAPAMPAAQERAGRPTMMAPTPIVPGRDVASDEALPLAPAAMVEWKMPTSRALMIGGAATAIIGLAAVGGDTGAIIALSGTAVAVYGLYLHYNR